MNMRKFGVLVLKYPAAIIQQRRRPSGVLGTSMSARIPKWAKMRELNRVASSYSELINKPTKRRLVKVAGSNAVCIPARSVVDLSIAGSVCRSKAVVEPLNTSLQGGLKVTSTLVDASKSSFKIHEVNHTRRGMSLKKQLCLANLQASGRNNREKTDNLSRKKLGGADMCSGGTLS